MTSVLDRLEQFIIVSRNSALMMVMLNVSHLPSESVLDFTNHLTAAANNEPTLMLCVLKQQNVVLVMILLLNRQIQLIMHMLKVMFPEVSLFQWTICSCRLR